MPDHGSATAPGRGSGEFGLWASPMVALALIAAWFALVVLFNVAPAIDKAASGVFFATIACKEGSAATACGVFGAARDWGLPAIRQALQILPASVAIVIAAMLARDLAAGQTWRDVRVRFESTAIAALIIGPGLLVNAGLKDHWGRPRPYMTELFGGRLPFVPAGELTHYCHSNCSFVSGEASSIFWLLCLVPLLPKHLRLRAAITLAALAVFACGLRVAFGAHYLSDVLLGGLSTLVVFSCLAVAVEWIARRSRTRAA